MITTVRIPAVSVRPGRCRMASQASARTTSWPRTISPASRAMATTGKARIGARTTPSAGATVDADTDDREERHAPQEIGGDEADRVVVQVAEGTTRRGPDPRHDRRRHRCPHQPFTPDDAMPATK